MTEEDVKIFLNDYYAAWGTGDPDNVVAFFTKDAVFEDLAFQVRFDGADAIRGFAELTYAGAPDFEVSPVELVIGTSGSGGQGATGAGAEWVMRGTHSGDFPGLPATGRRFEVRASSIIKFEGNRIQVINDYWNPDAFRAAVGL